MGLELARQRNAIELLHAQMASMLEKLTALTSTRQTGEGVTTDAAQPTSNSLVEPPEHRGTVTAPSLDRTRTLPVITNESNAMPVIDPSRARRAGLGIDEAPSVQSQTSTSVPGIAASTWNPTVRPLIAKHAPEAPSVVCTTTSSEPVSGIKRTKVNVQQPGHYKPTDKIVDWIHRMDQYMEQVSITLPKERALILSSGLNNEAYSRMAALRLDMALWTDGEALRAKLLNVFGECKTLSAYRAEFRAAKQKTDEPVNQFYDRVVALALAANPGQNPVDNQVLRDDIAAQFCENLREPQMRVQMLQMQFNNLEQLREYAIHIAGSYLISSGEASKNAETHKSSKIAVAHTTVADEEGKDSDDTENQRAQPRGKRKRSKSVDQAQSNAAINPKNARQTSPNRKKGTCGYCGKEGHQAEECRTRKREADAGKSRSDSTCVRCGRVGHFAKKCWADRHIDGANLAPNGVAKPDFWKTRDKTKDEAKPGTTSSTTMASSNILMSHLNETRDPSRPARGPQQLNW